MRNKVILLAISALLLILPAFGCITDDSKAPATSAAFVSTAQHAADVAALNASLAKKADQTSVDMLVKMMPAGGATATDTYPKTQLYTKAEVDAAISAATAGLKSDQTWITKTGGSTSTTGGSTGTPKGDVLSSNGDLELYLDKDMDDEIYINNAQAMTWFLTVKNNGNSGTYYRINANFDLSDSTPVNISSAPLTVANSTMASFASSTTIDCTPAPAVSGLAYASSQAGGTNKIYIGKNASISLVLVLTVTYCTPATVPGKLWTWDFSIRQLN
jgi:hypothetical protein